MNELELNELEIAPASVAKQSASDFAAALTETPQFAAFEEARLLFQQDEAGQKAMQAYQQKQQSLQMLLQLNAVTSMSGLNWNACKANGFPTLQSQPISRRKMNWSRCANHWATRYPSPSV